MPGNHWLEYLEKQKNTTRVEDTVKLVCTLDSFDPLQTIDEKNLEEKEQKESDEVQQRIAKTKVLDLGCGTGKDTLYFLKLGYDVTIQDGEAYAIEIVRERCRKAGLPQPKAIVAKFEDLQLTEQYDIINASLALPFVNPRYFPSFWIKIFQHLKENGRFSGNFFGNRHAWVNSPDGKNQVFLTYDQLREFIKPFCIQGFAEEATITETTLEGKKFWHQWDVVAQKKPVSPLLFLMPPAGNSANPKQEQVDAVVEKLAKKESKSQEDARSRRDFFYEGRGLRFVKT